MTKRPIGLRLSFSTIFGLASCSGVVKMKSASRPRIRRMASRRSRALSALFTAAVSTPRSSSLSDWSFISAMSGDTTIVVPRIFSVGSW